MNPILSLVQDANASSDPFPILYSDHMLAELADLHDEMILQLRLELAGFSGKADFFNAMIDQHKKTAALLRAQLGHREAENAVEGVVVITGEASSDESKARFTEFANRLNGVTAVCNNMTVKSRA